jgi:hypothetical protein
MTIAFLPNGSQMAAQAVDVLGTHTHVLGGTACCTMSDIQPLTVPGSLEGFGMVYCCRVRMMPVI